MEMPYTGFERVAQLAGEALRATGDERRRLVRRLEGLVKALVFRERLFGRWPPLGPDL